MRHMKPSAAKRAALRAAKYVAKPLSFASGTMSTVETRAMRTMPGRAMVTLARTNDTTWYEPLPRSRRKVARSMMKNGSTATDMKTRKAATKKRMFMREKTDDGDLSSPR